MLLLTMNPVILSCAAAAVLLSFSWYAVRASRRLRREVPVLFGERE